MKKCGIITYHFANNYGAILQCFALKSALECLGYECDILNYISDKQLDNNSLYRKKQGIRGIVKNICLLPFFRGRSDREHRFEKFRFKYLKCNNRLNNINMLQSFINSQEYDVIISGSDQVWNPNVYDFDKAFFFPFKANAKKVGYGISLGNASETQLFEYKTWINDFDVITVREKSSIKRIKEVSNRNNIIEVIDPLFLINPDKWKDLTKPVITKPYLLCYFVRTEDIGLKIKKAKKIATLRGLDFKVVNLRITKYNLFRNIIYNAGPLEFLNLLRNAEYVYTDSFHGTAFSLIFEKNFTTVDSNQEKIDNRKRNLLSKFDLDYRVQKADESDKLLSDIDYKITTESLSKLRELSLKELNTMVC